MSSRAITRRGALAALLATGACGFTPALAPGAATFALRDSVTVTAPDTIPGFAIRGRLQERLGRATQPAFNLTISLDQALDAAAFSQAGDALRYNVVGAAGWRLTTRDGTTVGQGQVEGFTSYSATGSTVATQAAATDAIGRLMVILGDMVVADLMLLDLPQ
ncbi:MAG: hypothetical protein KKB02_19755 [Alphaproteobacteria bacterium]|nr:hypothetical protein [Alphaproteobacteria bacterium]